MQLDGGLQNLSGRARSLLALMCRPAYRTDSTAALGRRGASKVSTVGPERGAERSAHHQTRAAPSASSQHGREEESM